MVQACLNGSRRPGEHPCLPLAPAELAAAAAACVEAGASSVHFHPRDAAGNETLDARHCAAAIGAVRAACSRTPVGISTGLWITRDVGARARAVGAWTVLPDVISVNLAEEGSADLCELAAIRGIGVEAGLASEEDAAQLLSSDLRPFRVLVEISEGCADPVLAADRVIAHVGRLPYSLLVHGEGRHAWTLVDYAYRVGCETRIGLEDTLNLPDGSPAADNEELVATVIAGYARPPA
jgi:uncharacterized protein (DUF849 family)